MRHEDVMEKSKDLSSELKRHFEARSSNFRNAVEHALGAELLGTLQPVSFEDDLGFGAALGFEFEGTELWLEEMQGTGVSLKRAGVEMPVISFLELDSEYFKEEFLEALRMVK